MRTYLKQASKGHNPKVKEPDIMHGFKMNSRVEKFGMGLDSLSAHTFRIIEIIEEEKNNIQGKQKQDIERMLKNA